MKMTMVANGREDLPRLLVWMWGRKRRVVGFLDRIRVARMLRPQRIEDLVLARVVRAVS